MMRLLLVVSVLLLGGPCLAGPPDACVRIPSHGGSGTVIWTGPGRTLILSCGHCFKGDMARRPISLDVPTDQPTGRERQAGVRLLAVDEDADLSLIEVLDGPLPFVAPVPAGAYTPSVRLVSCGYDEMREEQVRPCHILHDDGRTWNTRERPWHGRSGGGLIDLEGGYTIGVCEGYTGPRDHREVESGYVGMYIDLATIQRFLARNAGGGESGPPVLPRPVAPLARPRPSPGGS